MRGTLFRQAPRIFNFGKKAVKPTIQVVKKVQKAANPYTWAKALIPSGAKQKIVKAAPWVPKLGSGLGGLTQVLAGGSALASLIASATDPNAPMQSTNEGDKPGTVTYGGGGTTIGTEGGTGPNYKGKGGGGGGGGAGGLKNNLGLGEDTELGNFDTSWMDVEPESIKGLGLVDMIIKDRKKTEVDNLKTQYDTGLRSRETSRGTR